MTYTSYLFRFSDNVRAFADDVFPEYLSELPFESFMSENDGLVGYVAQDDSGIEDGVKKAIEAFIASFPQCDSITYEKATIADQNWNETWEKESFKPILIGDECVVHSPFHTDVPHVKYDILIDPHQSFGSGAHETTSLMIRHLLNEDMTGKRVMDVGCGTAILGILALKKGAESLSAFDIDEWAYENAKLNLTLNNIVGADLRLGGFEVMPEGRFDVVLANITKNILLEGFPMYASRLTNGGKLFVSGFFHKDVDEVTAVGANLGLKVYSHTEDGDWSSLAFIKD